MMADSRPIGFFDSGIGGLSIWREVVQRLPQQTTVYLADNAYCPYGSRSTEQVQARAVAITHFLLQQHCRLIVVACNTASAAALALLRSRFDVPFVGIEPAIKPAAQATRTGHVGVLATLGTIQGPLFQNTSRRYAHGVQLHLQIGHGLVEQVEAGQLHHPVTEQLLRQYLEPMLAAGVDQIVLGCTHYPFLLPLMRQLVNGQAHIIDPAPAVARQVQSLLPAEGIQLPPRVDRPAHQFYTTGPARTFALEGQPSPIWFEQIDV